MQTHYDIVIVGGGVQGCGIAQAAAAAGFNVLLLEKNTWGCATSRSSSKLIHGGLRYLQTAQFSLVRESLEERDWMLDHAPDLVQANWFHIPLYKSSTIRPWKIWSGLTLYQCLSGFSLYGKFKRLPKSGWAELNGLSTKNLQAVFAYQDAQTDDQLLTQHIQKSAEILGAKCVEHAELVRATKQHNGYDLAIKQGKKEHNIITSLVINATGPWVNHTLACFTPAVPALNIDLVQGTHIVINERISDVCFYLEAPSDKRAVFVLPWKGKTLIGTTETLFVGSPENAEPLDSEIDYLLETAKHYFPKQSFTVIDTFCGLRVLPKADGRAFFRPRDVHLEIADNLITVCGGKLTCWRVTASQVMKEIEEMLGERKKVDTRTIEL